MPTEPYKRAYIHAKETKRDQLLINTHLSTGSPPAADAARLQSEEDGPEPPMLRVWLQGKLGAFVEPFKEGDEVGGRSVWKRCENCR